MAFLDNTGLSYLWGKIKAYVSSAISGKENASNKVTSLSASSTNTEYPSARAVYSAITQVDDKYAGMIAEKVFTRADMQSLPINLYDGDLCICEVSTGAWSLVQILDYFSSGDQLVPGVMSSVVTIENLLNDLAFYVSTKEDASNKVTSLSASSTDAQYPSAKAVWDILDHGLLYRGVLTSEDDINDTTLESGWYEIQSSIPQNVASTQNWSWSRVYITKADTLIHQYFIKTLGALDSTYNKRIYMAVREYSGSPLAWQAFKTFSPDGYFTVAVTLAANGWTLNSSTGYYTQTETATGITAKSYPSATVTYPSGTTETTKKAIDKAANLLVGMTTAANSVTFSAVAAPATDLTITLKE